MNEVEKLYRNCGVENYRLENYSGFVPDGYIIIDDENKEGYVKEIVRDFTATKQIELIKFLLDKYCDIRIRKNLEGDYYIKSFNDISCFSEDFKETLASFTNTHLQDLTEPERAEIKEILE